MGEAIFACLMVLVANSACRADALTHRHAGSFAIARNDASSQISRPAFWGALAVKRTRQINLIHSFLLANEPRGRPLRAREALTKQRIGRVWP